MMAVFKKVVRDYAVWLFYDDKAELFAFKTAETSLTNRVKHNMYDLCWKEVVQYGGQAYEYQSDRRWWQ